ncbi:type I-B CRISPR-associated endonuclease Cas1b [Treponema sp. J25]|uniref:type I-B CRISPR-associated endonuclease Cas1b n=1 Tax=Treponema sp. J25 TaxID=2094121 RepID=UPI001043F217|nr:type I-B CRISPR-associated endonuclease Cas1b [Treponema sp. J25]TCW61804.1 subtype I-B CRISPR-associated endonuclease Cas1 [Treponema sp. J25]
MKDYYIFKSGRISRKDNSIFLETKDGDIPIPVNDIDSLYLFGEIDLNTKAINFFAQQGIVLHFFNYYGWWTGSFYPREELLSGEVIVHQVEHYLDPGKRLDLAKEFVQGAIHGFIYNLKRYSQIGEDIFAHLNNYSENINNQPDISALMGLEGNARDCYYGVFPKIIKQEIEFEKRVKHPPDNMMNALISFVNSLVYTAVIKEIYRTQLNPTISYLHEPSYRRFSLALDVAEIFKPIYGDRVIFDLLNNHQITEKNFDKELNYCYLKEDGRKIVVKAFDEKMKTTIIHKKLKRKVSYQKIIRLELYKLIKHVIGETTYKSFRVWW